MMEMDEKIRRQVGVGLEAEVEVEGPAEDEDELDPDDLPTSLD